MFYRRRYRRHWFTPFYIVLVPVAKIADAITIIVTLGFLGSQFDMDLTEVSIRLWLKTEGRKQKERQA